MFTSQDRSVGRGLTLAGEFYYDGNNGTGSEKSHTAYKDSEDIRDLLYKSRGNLLGSQLELTYVSRLIRNYSFLEVFTNASLSTTPIVSASWFDSNGVRYSLPVNAKKPGTSTSIYAWYNQPFGKEKNFTFSLDGDVSYSFGTGYQASSRLEPIDSKNFKYDVLMKQLWGNGKGDKFYSGESGFSESRTSMLSYSISGAFYS